MKTLYRHETILQNIKENIMQYFGFFLSSVMRYVLRSETMNKHNLLCDILCWDPNKNRFCFLVTFRYCRHKITIYICFCFPFFHFLLAVTFLKLNSFFLCYEATATG